MGETKTIKEILVWPLEDPAYMEDFINLKNRVPTWQSRPCVGAEYDIIHSFLLTERRC